MTEILTPTPTQVKSPWRATIRTVLQAAVAIATLLPFLLGGIYTDMEQAPILVTQVLAVAAMLTRLMALPQVEVFLRRYMPFLAAEPSSDV